MKLAPTDTLLVRSPHRRARRGTVRAWLLSATMLFAWGAASPGFSQDRAQIPAGDRVAATYQAPTARIIAAATAEETGRAAWMRLAELTDRYPNRLAGTANLDHAIAWARDLMVRDGLENIRLEEVMVPHWVRGDEQGAITGPYPQPIAIATLGGSIGTAPEGLEAPVLVVRSFEELDARATEARGRIVLFNVPFDETMEPLDAYRAISQYRGGGAARAAAHGAVGMMVRSTGPIGHRTPHTGGMRYPEGVTRIPAVGVSGEDAELLQRMQDRGEPATVRLVLGAHQLPDVMSGNLIGELVGRERPDEVVVIACHIDSWDISPGAMDDGGGCVAVMEAARILKALDLRPRRTVRVILFTNEENGLRGGQAYLQRYRGDLDRHVLVMETDSGVLPINGYSYVGSDAGRAVVADIVGLLAPLGGTGINDRLSGSDLFPIIRAGDIPALSLDVDRRRYFYLHHTAADTVDKVVPSELAGVIAALASIAYVAADLPETLPRGPGASRLPGG